MNSVNYDQIQHNYDVVSTGNVHIITVGTGPEAHEISVLNLVNDNVIEENVDFILLMKTDMGSSMIGTLYGRFHAEDPVFSSGQFGMTLINSDYYLNLQHTSGDGYVVITDANGDNIDDDFGVTLLKLKNSPLTSDNFDEIYAAIGTTNFLRSWIEVAGINNMINDALAQANIPDIYGFYSMKFKKLVDTRLGSWGSINSRQQNATGYYYAGSFEDAAPNAYCIIFKYVDGAGFSTNFDLAGIYRGTIEDNSDGSRLLKCVPFNNTDPSWEADGSYIFTDYNDGLQNVYIQDVRETSDNTIKFQIITDPNDSRFRCKDASSYSDIIYALLRLLPTVNQYI